MQHASFWGVSTRTMPQQFSILRVLHKHLIQAEQLHILEASIIQPAASRDSRGKAGCGEAFFWANAKMFENHFWVHQWLNWVTKSTWLIECHPFVWWVFWVSRKGKFLEIPSNHSKSFQIAVVGLWGIRHLTQPGKHEQQHERKGFWWVTFGFLSWAAVLMF